MRLHGVDTGVTSMSESRQGCVRRAQGARATRQRVDARPTVIFRTAAGTRLGFGHLVRMSVLAKALGVPFLLSVRGTRRAAEAARRVGATLVPGMASSVLAVRPGLLVIDDPSASAARTWRRVAAAQGIPVASVHDLGLARCDADVEIDGSVAPGPASALGEALFGTRFLILRAPQAPHRRPAGPSVLIALGGGPRVRSAVALAAAIRAIDADVPIRVAGGMTAACPAHLPGRTTWVGPTRGLTAELTRATVAIVGGGLSLYEACATGTPAIGVAVVAAQRPTIDGLSARGAAIDGGDLRSPSRVARLAVSLLFDRRRQLALARAGRRAVDGRGAARVAARLLEVAREGLAPRRTGKGRAS